MARHSIRAECGLLVAAALAAATAWLPSAFTAGSLVSQATPGRVSHAGAVGAQNSVASARIVTSAITGSSAPTVGTMMGALVLTAAWVANKRMRGAAVARRGLSRTEWYRKVKRVGADQAVFDVTIPKPLGLKMEIFPQRSGVGISEIVKDGNTDKVNQDVILNETEGMWVLEGDRVMAVNGEDTDDSNIEEVVELIIAAGDSVTLTLMRNTRKGPIKVIYLPENLQATVRRGARLSSAAEAAIGRELKYGCIDGWCGTCWHRERTTNGIFKPCCDVLTGDWDNVMPLVITPKPEKAGDSTYLNPRGA